MSSSFFSGLDLTEYVHCPDEPQPIYDLYAISNHFGGMGGGHCKSCLSLKMADDMFISFSVDTAYAKNHETKKWYNYDDSHVSETSEDRLVVRTPHNICYDVLVHVPPLVPISCLGFCQCISLCTLCAVVPFEYVMSCDLLLNNCFLLQTAAAYVLFYRRRTEGKPVRRNILDRSLSQSFAEEHKKLKEKYATLDEEDEEKEKDDAAKVDGIELNASTESKNEVNTVYSSYTLCVCPPKSIKTFALSHSF